MYRLIFSDMSFFLPCSYLLMPRQHPQTMSDNILPNPAMEGSVSTVAPLPECGTPPLTQLTSALGYISH